MLRPVAAFCRLLQPVLLLVLFPWSRSAVVGVPGLCWLRRVPCAVAVPSSWCTGVVLVAAAHQNSTSSCVNFQVMVLWFVF